MDESEQGTFRRLESPAGNTICWTAEPPNRGNLPDLSCIPPDRYRVDYLPRSASGRYREMYWVRGAPNRWGILFHAGNWCGERAAGLRAGARGCILPGLRLGRTCGQQAVQESATEYQFTREDGDPIRYAAMEVAMPGGSRVTALPATPDTARGFSTNVLLDEFAFHQHGRAIWTALLPVVSKPGLKIRVISTPHDRRNKFYELCTSATGWSRHRVML